MKRDDFVKYHGEHYVTNATTLVVAGKITEKQVLAEVKKVFGHIKKQKKSQKLKVVEKQDKPKVLLKFKETDQTHFVLATRTFDLFNKKNAVLSVLSGVLGGGMSSRLFQKLREEMGVCYYVRAYSDPFTDHGFFQISAGVDNKRLEEVLEAILEECRKLVKEKVSTEELNKVKECLIGNMKLSLESSDDIANFFGGQELLRKKIDSAEQKAKEVRRVTATQIQNLAKEIFKNEKLNLAIIGPVKEEEKFLKILKF
jgi:predicted Zn-dependent peptidase